MNRLTSVCLEDRFGSPNRNLPKKLKLKKKKRNTIHLFNADQCLSGHIW